MPNTGHTAAASLDHDLDALVTGTPEHDHASEWTSDPATSADLRRAAHQFHGLAARADRRAEDAATRQTLDSIWENVMNGHVPSATTVAPLSTLIPGRRPRSRPHLKQPGVTRWHGIANGLLAAVLILAIAAGFWRSYDFLGPGRDGDGDQASHIAGLTAQDATPSGSPVRVDMPTAEDCTVEPLTVDRVMELVEDPYDLGDRIVGTPGPPPPSVIEPSTYPTQEVMDEIDAVHRQVVACAMAGSPFQVWALVHPARVAEDVLQALPVFADESEVRAYLGQLQDGHIDEQAVSLASKYGLLYGAPEKVTSVLMVDPNPRNSITLPADQTLDIVRVGALYCTPGGVVESIEPGVTARSTTTQTYFQYHYSTAEGRWVLDSVPGAG